MMCESKVVLIEGGKLSVIMDAAAKVTVLDDRIVCTDITGQEIGVDGVRVKEMNLVKHEIILARGR